MDNKTTICSLKDDKCCAVTFTTDDALYSSCVFYQSKFKEYGLRGTAAITTDFIHPSENGNIESNGYGTWEEWQVLMNEGFFDIMNHTKSHPYLDRISPEQLETEVNETRLMLRARFPGQKVLCIANPFVVTNDTVDKVICQQHYSARNGHNGFNTLDPTGYEWYHLNFQTALHNATAESMNVWIDQAIENQLWLIEMWHGVDGQGWEPPASAECGSHLAYLSKKLDTVWNGTMGEVTAYLREKQHASVNTVVRDDSEIQVLLSTDLDTLLFDQPLTLKTVVPPNWNAVRLFCGDRQESLNVKEQDNLRYVCYNAIPNTETIFLRNRD